MDGGRPDQPASRGSTQLAGLGVELAGAVGGGCLLGYWVDCRFGTQPWGLVIGASVGIVGGLYNLVRKAVHESVRTGTRSPTAAPRPPVGPDDHVAEGQPSRQQVRPRTRDEEK
jgi:F0F1-type ATP synthase assembly protein I